MMSVKETIEEFLFDVLGLAIPGIILIFFFFLPGALLFLAEPRPGAEFFVDKPLLHLNYRSIFYLSRVFKQNNIMVAVISLIVAYLAGHPVKFFGVVYYEFMGKLFDETILPLLKGIGQRFRRQKKDDGFPRRSGALSYFFSKAGELFVFHADRFDRETLEEVYERCRTRLKKRYGLRTLPEWNRFYKIVHAEFTAEKFPSMMGKYLTKYNFYRSVAFVFLANVFYTLFMLDAYPMNSDGSPGKVTTSIIFVSLLSYYAFHQKYKKYWTMTGSEAILTCLVAFRDREE